MDQARLLSMNGCVFLTANATKFVFDDFEFKGNARVARTDDGGGVARQWFPA